MAWEKLSRRQADLSLVGVSAVWIAMVLAGARLTNFNEPYAPFAIAGISAFFLRARLSRWEIYGWLLISALLVKVIHLPQVPFWILRLAASMALLGFGAALILGLRALWSERDDRDNAIALLAPALVLIVFILGCARVLSLTSGVNPQTDDAWLYAFDGSLGFQPSFVLGRITYNSLSLTRVALLTYLSLPFAMAFVCAWQIPRGARRVSWYMLTVLLLAGAAGWMLYTIVPGTGPTYAFGRGFPWDALPYNALQHFALGKMKVPVTIPRNAMPSLHVAWAVLLCWNSRRFSAALRSVMVLFLLITVFATLGTGQHYLVDLVASLPFAVSVQAAAFLLFRAQSAAGRSRLITAAIAGLAITFAWLGIVRFGVGIALESPLIPWSLMLAAISSALWLRHRMLQSEVLLTKATAPGSSGSEARQASATAASSD